MNAALAPFIAAALDEHSIERGLAQAKSPRVDRIDF
jgi:hypothetical protein